MLSRRNLIVSGATTAAAALAALDPRRILGATRTAAEAGTGRNTPVITPNVTSLPWRMEDGFKTFHLVAEPLVREFAPGFKVNCWGYNGESPGHRGH
jgi:hypothetical protein